MKAARVHYHSINGLQGAVSLTHRMSYLSTAKASAGARSKGVCSSAGHLLLRQEVSKSGR